MGEGPPCIDLQDLEGWLSDRNCELRNAIEFGSLIDVAEAKRRCITVASSSGVQQ